MAGNDASQSRTPLPRGARLSARRPPAEPVAMTTAAVVPGAAPLAVATPRFAWKPQYAMGEDAIDGQHRMLLDLASLLCDAARQGKGRAVIRTAFDALRVYTNTHFREEEAFFARIGCPLLDAHRGEHGALLRELNALAEDALPELVAGAAGALEHWVETRLVVHMTHDDQDAFRSARPSR